MTPSRGVGPDQPYPEKPAGMLPSGTPGCWTGSTPPRMTWACL